MKARTAFISYSWDSDEHREWVRNLAAQLRADGIDVTLDQWHAVPGDQLPKFMETSIQSSEFVLVICTPAYKTKSEKRIGGVGYEGDIIASELFVSQNQRKYIPVLRQGEWNNAAPIWLSGKYYIDLRGEYPQHNYQDLLTTLNGQRPSAPPIGNTSQTVTKAAVEQSAPPQNLVKGPENIKVKGIILEEVTSPRNDGSRGSALYKVPFRLSQRPSTDWQKAFLHFWDHPPQFTTMHRPGIARIAGDKLILDGTTIEEVEEYHLETLKLVLKETNSAIARLETEKERLAAQEQERKRQHDDHLKDIADRLKFD